MTLAWHFSSQDSIDLQDAIEHLNKQGPDLFTRNLEQTAGVLWQLRNNRDFLLNWALKRLEQAGRLNLVYTPQVFVIHVSEYYFIRAVIWQPDHDQRRGEEIFFYEDPHDHNFNFFTVNYFGPGYRTVVFEYQHADVNGIADELVSVQFSEDTVLEPGKVVLFRKGVDIHTQFPPASVSISLNIMEKNLDPDQIQTQYMFNTSKGVVSSRMTRYNAETFIDLLGADSSHSDLLESLANSPEANPYVKAHAIHSLSQIDQQRARDIAEASDSALVKILVTVGAKAFA